jgi:aminoglycoside 6'-N-acetyltransferase
LFFKWLQAPHVKAWWDKNIQWTPQLLKEKYGSYIHGYKLEAGIKEPLQAYIISIDAQPVGYIQLYNPRDYFGEELMDELTDSLAGLDFFIGETEYLGKGLGSLILRKFLEEYVDPSYDSCLVDPNTANIRAIRAYEKAGFKVVKTVKEGNLTWMVRMKVR